MLPLIVVASSLALTGCNGQAGSNAASNVANIIAEEGVEDLNSSIEGDQLSPNAEAADDLAGNGAASVPAKVTKK